VTERDDGQALLSAMAGARERFLELVAEVRPELHRYCARMTGSVFDGEDVVQDTLARAYFALAEMEQPPPLRPWLFRIAHNTAMDFLRRYERRNVDVVAEVPESASDERGADPGLVEAALVVFAALPPQQRSALALKDVLGHSLEETAATMGTTVAAVKSALVRARARVVAGATVPRPEPAAGVSPEERDSMRRYAALFNARDWDGLRALFGEESRLDLITRSQRRGPSAAQYCSRYAVIAETEQLSAQPGLVDGVPVIAMFRAGAVRPAYFVQLVWERGRIALVRDFHYVPYIADDALFTPG
jgi:RNA polymerase sigma factor (sigma-70 family)